MEKPPTHLFYEAFNFTVNAVLYFGAEVVELFAGQTYFKAFGVDAVATII
jgi:hypothetical protein